MFFTCILVLSAVQPVPLIQLSGKPAGNFLFLLTGSSSSSFKNFRGPFVRDQQRTCIFFKLMMTTGEPPKNKALFQTGT